MSNVYKAICGSRSYGLELPTSDYDIVVCGEAAPSVALPHSHEIIIKPEDFTRKFLLLTADAYDMQLSFPREVLVESDLSQYINLHKENIIVANLDRVYKAYMKKADGMSMYLAQWCLKYPKRAAYSCLFYDTLYRYATQDISFEEAFRPAESFKEWLLAVRRKEVSAEEILKTNNELRNKAEQVYDFYAKIENKAFLNRTVTDLRELLNIGV